MAALRCGKPRVEWPAPRRPQLAFRLARGEALGADHAWVWGTFGYRLGLFLS